MSVSTHISFLNGNDPDFLAAKNWNDDEREHWQEWEGNFDERPGKTLETPSDAVEETEDEYGGWIIDLSKIPKETTHIVVYRC